MGEIGRGGRKEDEGREGGRDDTVLVITQNVLLLRHNGVYIYYIGGPVRSKKTARNDCSRFAVSSLTF